MNDTGFSIVGRAISFAAREHRHQCRKDGETPYVAHPMRVMMVLRHVFGIEDTEILAAGVLHDTLEDTTADRDDLIENFGERVAAMVAALSKDMRLPEQQREEQYFTGLDESPVEVKICKLADTYDNLADSLGLSHEQRQKTIRKAKQTLELFQDSLTGQWDHILEKVRQQIETHSD